MKIPRWKDRFFEGRIKRIYVVRTLTGDLCGPLTNKRVISDKGAVSGLALKVQGAKRRNGFALKQKRLGFQVEERLPLNMIMKLVSSRKKWRARHSQSRGPEI